MKKVKRSTILFLVVISLLSGCSTTKITNLNTSEAIAPQSNEIKAVKSHFEYMGLEHTPGIASGHYTVKDMRMSGRLLYEIFPGRIRFAAWAANAKTGKEYQAQALFAGLNTWAKPHVTLVMDGDQETGLTPESKVAVFSTNYTRVYEIIDHGPGKSQRVKEHMITCNFFGDANCRVDIIDQYGTLISSLKEAEVDPVKIGVVDEQWGYFTDDDGARFYSPLPEEKIKQIATINPKYDYMDKFVANTHAMISVNPYSTAATFIIDAIVAAVDSSAGPSMDDESNEALIGPTVEYLLNMFVGEVLKIRKKLKSKEGRKEILTQLRIELRDEVRAELRAELEDEVRAQEIINVRVSNRNEQLHKKNVVSTKDAARWIWDSSKKDPYRVSQQSNLEFVRRTLALFDIDAEVQRKLLIKWHNQTMGLTRVSAGQKVTSVIAKNGVRHDNVTVNWKDRSDVLSMTYSTEYKGETYTVSEVAGYWVLL